MISSITPTIGQRRRSSAIPAKKQAEPVRRPGCTKNVRARPSPWIIKEKKRKRSNHVFLLVFFMNNSHTRRSITPTMRNIFPNAKRARSKKSANPSKIKKNAKPINPAPIRWLSLKSNKAIDDERERGTHTHTTNLNRDRSHWRERLCWSKTHCLWQVWSGHVQSIQWEWAWSNRFNRAIETEGNVLSLAHKTLI